MNEPPAQPAEGERGGGDGAGRKEGRGRGGRRDGSEKQAIDVNLTGRKNDSGELESEKWELVRISCVQKKHKCRNLSLHKSKFVTLPPALILAACRGGKPWRAPSLPDTDGPWR